MLYRNGDIGANGADSRIMQILVHRGCATKKRINPGEIKFRLANRGGVGAQSKEIGPLMEDISRLSWMSEATALAICTEVEPGSLWIEIFNRKWIAESDVELAPVLELSIKYSSLACGHTNISLRSIAAKCPSRWTRLGNGTNYDVAVIAALDKNCAQAVLHGHDWMVLKWFVALQYFELLDLVQVSRKVRSSIRSM